MGKPKRKKPTRVNDLAAKKVRDVRGGKKAADESVSTSQDKASGGWLGALLGTITSG
jgi:hypothetical protein